MSLIIVIFGASGSGKSTLMELLAQSGKPYSIQIKATDRPPRQYDGVEIRCVSSVATPQYDYIFQAYGFHYGIQRSQIDSAIAAHRHHFIICNNLDVIKKIRNDYPNRVRVVFHYFDAPPEKFLAIQMARGIEDDEIKLRLEKNDATYKTFVQNPELFDDVLYNHFGDDPKELLIKIEQSIELFAARSAARLPDSRARLNQFATKLEARLSENRINGVTLS